MKQFKAPSIEELQPHFPSHHIQSFIAQGGMGAVYLANQISLDRPVAIKILPREFGADAEYRASFETEAKGMARLNHSNLVGIHDFGHVDGMLFIIMEYIPGRSLYTVANEVAVEQLEAANLIAEMCHGLAHAHKAGLLHRDIKPANVLIDDDAQPKIVDFGLVRPMGVYQTEGEVFGTPGYTAPEVLNDPLKVDQRSDIFSMGIMLYELLTAQLPDDPFVTASELSQSDKRFDHIIAKAINPDPNLRYHTAGQMAAALEDLMKTFEEAPGGLKRVTTAPNNALNAMVSVNPSPTGQTGVLLQPAATSGLGSAPLVTDSRATNALGTHSALLNPASLQSNSKGGSKTGLVILLLLLIIGGVAMFVMNQDKGNDNNSKKPVDSSESPINKTMPSEAVTDETITEETEEVEKSTE